MQKKIYKQRVTEILEKNNTKNTADYCGKVWVLLAPTHDNYI